MRKWQGYLSFGIIKYWWVLALLSFFFSLNNQSFWIDECCTALCAMQESFSGCWEQICRIGGSDAQIAFYYYLLLLWHHITGADSELSLRMFNILWVLLSALFFRNEPKALVMLLISPFFVYYSNELRPYILQVAASCSVSILFWRACDGEKIKFNLFFCSLFFLCLTSLTGCVWSVGFVVAFMVMAFRQFKGKRFWVSLMYWFIPFAGLATYYIYTLFLGARAVSISSSWMVNVCAVWYELLGLYGLGPSRFELRECVTPDSIWSIDGLWLGSLVGFVLIFVLIYGIILCNKQNKKTFVFALMILVCLPLGIFVYGSVVMDFRFSGRHCAPLLPLLCLLLSQIISSDCVYFNFCRVGLFLLMIGIWIVSDFRIRFSDSYSREDYRTAISCCQLLKNENKDVLLLCNWAGQKFYKWQQGVLKDKWTDYESIVVSRPSEYASFLYCVDSSGLYKCTKLCQGFVHYARIDSVKK